MGGSWWLRIFDWQVADMVALNVGVPVEVKTGEFFSISAEFESRDLRAAAGGAVPHATYLGDCQYHSAMRTR